MSDAKPTSETEKSPICGMVRPISALRSVAGDEYTREHWEQVHEIVAEAVTQIGYQLRLVSESQAPGVIVGGIFQRLADDPIVVCDVSGHNPNVTYELGVRVAFQKPVVIIKDDITPFAFDIQAIEHVPYPRTLHYPSILQFRSKIAAAVEASVRAANEGQSSYLQQFGVSFVPKLDRKDVGVQEIAIELGDVKSMLIQLVNSTNAKFASEDDLSVGKRAASNANAAMWLEYKRLIDGIRILGDGDISKAPPPPSPFHPSDLALKKPPGSESTRKS